MGGEEGEGVMGIEGDGIDRGHGGRHVCGRGGMRWYEMVGDF